MPRVSSVWIVFNPKARGGRLGAMASAVAGSLADSAIGWQATGAPGDGVAIAEQAGAAGAATVVAFGGDGTVHEVVNGLMRLPPGDRPALAIVPAGSGNDFAFACGIPTPRRRGDDFAASLRAAIAAPATPVDVGTIADDRGRRAFWINTVGLLFDAAVNLHSHRAKAYRPLRGRAVYLYAAVRAFATRFHATDVTLTLDDRIERRRLLMATLGNGPREGGAFRCTPGSRIDDGLLECLEVDMRSRPATLRLLPSIMRGRHLRHPGVRLTPCRRLVMESPQAILAHLDGELWAGPERSVHRIEASVLRGALRVHRPAPAGSNPA